MQPTYDPATKQVLLGLTPIGHVVRRAKITAGARKGGKPERGTLAAGTRKHFWTAVPLNRWYGYDWWRPGDGTSIGTRFATLDDAVTALAFHNSELQSGDDWRTIRKQRWGF